MPVLNTAILKNRFITYGVALGMTGIGFLLRIAITHFTGPDLATYITFYPFLIFAAVLGGLGPGLLATAVSALIVNYWFLRPYGAFGIKNPADAVEAVLFIIMGVLISVMAEFYRRNQQEQADYARSLIEVSLDPLVTISHEGKITDVNEATIKVTGVNREGLIGTDFSNYFTKPEKAREGYQQVFAKGFVSDYPLTIRHKDGSLIDVLYNAAVYKDDKENILGVFAAARDVTEQKKTAQKLKESYAELEKRVVERTEELTNKVEDLEEARTAMMNVMEDFEAEKNKTTAILTNMGDGMIATDEERRIIYMSHSAEEMLDWSTKDAIGKHISDWLVMEDEKGHPIPAEQRPVHLVLSTGKKIVTTTTTTTTTTYYFAPKNKKKFPVGYTASPVVAAGKTIGVIMVFRDITHDKEVDQMKTEFISLASHQLRTPLSAMKWFSEMLINGDAGALNDEQRDFANNISDSNERMISLVNSLLNISRIESGRIVIDPKPTDLKELVDEVIKELQNKIDEKKQSLIVSVHSEIPKINIDPKLVREVYSNLLSNALKYTPAGGEIVVFISRKGEELISQVSDKGYGIPKKDYHRVFQKFYRGDNIVKLETEGTGLGLYMAKAVVESSGGKIWFKSEEGKGTTFWFTLPMKGSQARMGDVALDS